MKSIGIVTTAAPPWLTGTAINPLWRAITFARMGFETALLFPWVAPREQPRIFPHGLIFATQADQEQWIRERYPCGALKIRFYPARWFGSLGSIHPSRELGSQLPAMDLLLLEEPEHLAMIPASLFEPALSARKLHSLCPRVIGILHTNYEAYLQDFLSKQAWMPAPLARLAVRAVMRRYRKAAASTCDRLIRLSSAIEGYEGAVAANVNGTDSRFSLVPPAGQAPAFYCMAKLIWEKGFGELIELAERASIPAIDVFGKGPCEDAIRAKAQGQGARLRFHGATTEPWVALAPYKALINPSRTEVLCTVTAEALAMGKFAIIPRHPSNEPFYANPNCLPYGSPEEFAQRVAQALATSPRDGSRHDLSWERANERLLGLLASSG